MSDINEIKKALAESTQGKWEQHEDTVKMGEWMVISTYSKTEDAHLIANAPEWISSLITTIESQKEEIEKQRVALLETLDRVHDMLVECNSLKAITELAKSGFKDIQHTESVFVANRIAEEALEQIERLQNG